MTELLYGMHAIIHQDYNLSLADMLVIAAETLSLLPHTRFSRTCMKHLKSFVCIIQQKHEQKREGRASAGKFPLFCFSCRHQHKTNEIVSVSAGKLLVPCSALVNAYWGLVEWKLSEENRNAWINNYPSATSATVNISVTNTGLKTGLRLEKIVTECLG